VLPDLIRFWDTLWSVESGDRQTFFVAATVACVLVANNEGLLVYNDFADIMRNLQRGLQVRPRLAPVLYMHALAFPPHLAAWSLLLTRNMGGAGAGRRRAVAHRVPHLLQAPPRNGRAFSEGLAAMHQLCRWT
jgi:hypothetical protein